MVVPPPDDAAVTSSSAAAGTGRESAGGRRLLLAALALLAVLSGALVLWFLAQGRGEVAMSRLRDDPVQVEEQDARDDVMSQTRQFALRMGTFSADDLDDKGQLADYRALVSEVITPKFKASFDRQVVVAEAMAKQVGDSRKAQVFATGVSALDADSATALVAGAFTDTYAVGGKQQPQEPVPFRYEVTLEKIDGTWLVDDFTPVTDQDAAAQQAPSGGATP